MGFFNKHETPETPKPTGLDNETQTPKSIDNNTNALINGEDDSLAKLEKLISNFPTEEELMRKRIFGPTGKPDESGLKELEEMIKKLPTSLEITQKEVEDAAKALIMKWKLEAAFAAKKPVSMDREAVAARELEAMGAGIKFPEDKEDDLFQDYRRKVYAKLFGVAESFAKAREEALGKIDIYENEEKFKAAREEAIEYIDKLIGDKAMNERVNSPEFQTAVAKVKEEAIERLAKM